MERQVSNDTFNDDLAEAFQAAVEAGHDPIELLGRMTEIITLSEAASFLTDGELCEHLSEAAKALVVSNLPSIAVIVNEAAFRISEQR